MSDIWGDFITFKLIKLFRPGINEAANSWLIRIWEFRLLSKGTLNTRPMRRRPSCL